MVKLTYEQFAKQPRHRGMSKKELDAAWTQHKADSARSQSVSRPSASPRTSTSSLAKKKKTKRNEVNPSAVEAKTLLDYFMGQMNPFSKKAATRIPDGLGGLTPSTCVQHFEVDRLGTASYNSGTQYAMGIMVRPDINRFSLWNDINAANGHMIIRSSQWTAQVSEAALREKYESFRVVSMGLRVRYDGTPSLAKGVLVGFVIPPGFDYTDMKFQDMANLPYAKVGPAIDGMEVTSFPFGNTDGWRHTKSISPINGTTTWDGGSSWPGPQSAFLPNLELAQYIPATFGAAQQQEISDVMEVNDIPRIAVYGVDLDASAEFIVEIVCNLELQIERKTNSPANSSSATETVTISSAENLEHVQKAIQKAVDDHGGPGNTRKQPSFSASNQSKSKISKSLTDYLTPSNFSTAAGVASTVYDLIDGASIASTAVEWAGPTIAEIGLGALALL